MGVVYLGRSPGGLLVAVKVIWARYAGDAEFRARFRREITAARTVSGAYTASVLDADPDAGAPWLVTAYLPGLSLREAISGHGRFPASTVRTLAAGVAEALVDIHRAGLTHRDLKPGNIMLTADGPRVIDFGIARPEDATAITRAGVNPGTPGFMSPEQAAGGEVGQASDVFSFGAVLTYAATAEEPFRADGVTETVRRVRAAQADLSEITDGWLRGLIRDCLRREQGQRPSAADLLTRLDGALFTQGAAWLPAGVVDAIDRRTAEARHLPKAPMSGPQAGSAAPVPADQVRMAEATADPEVAGGGGAPWVLSRRQLVFGGAAMFAVVGGTAAGVAFRDSDTDRPAATSGTTKPPANSRAGSSRSPRVPPRAEARWKVRVSDYYPDLSVAGGLVLAHGDGMLRALDPATGKTRWKHRSFDADHVSVVGGDVFLVDHFQAPEALAVVRAASGANRWTYPWPERDQVPMYPVASGSVAVFGYDSVTALNLSNGRRRWTAPVKTEFGIAVDGDLVVAVNRTTVSALDVASGRRRWTYRAEWAHYPQACYGLVFFCDGPGTLYALRADNGQLVWRKPIGETVYESFGFRSGGGLVYLGTAEGDILAMRAATGELVWSRRLGSDASRNQWNALGVSRGTLYVGCADEHVYALNGADGRTMWTYPADVTVRTSAPVTVGGLVFIGTGDGSVKALSPPGRA